MTERVAFVIPIYEPHFRWGQQLAESFRYFLGNSVDLWFIFSTVSDKELFPSFCKSKFYSAIYDGKYGYGGHLINAKKLFAVEELSNSYEYMIVYDSETLITGPFDWYAYCKRFSERRIIYGTDLELLRGQRWIQSYIDKTYENYPFIKRKSYGWWVQPPIYRGKDIKDFLSRINTRDINPFTFDHLLYQNYLLHARGWKEEAHDLTFVELGWPLKEQSSKQFKEFDLAHICRWNADKIKTPVVIQLDKKRAQGYNKS